MRAPPALEIHEFLAARSRASSESSGPHRAATFSAGNVPRVRRKIVVTHVSYQRTPFNAPEYERRTREGPCFICAIADGDPDYRGATAMIYEDSDVLVFLNRYPTLRGYTLVCPRRHVHWHIAPLPPGVPYAEQQLAALAMSRGILSIPADDLTRLAREIREELFAGA